MPDQTAFEARLTDAYARYVAAAPTPVDPRAMAATVAAGRVRRSSGWRPVFGPGRRIALLIAVGLLLVSLAVGAVFVASQVAPRPSALPTTAPTAIPTAAAPTDSPSDPSGYRGIFTPSADMTIGRRDAIVVTLNGGRVLIVAGQDGMGGRSDVPAEVWYPSTGRSDVIALDAPTGWGGGSGIVMRDGRVLIIVHDNNLTSSSATIFDPGTMSFHRVRQGGYSNAPVFGVNPTMALLHDGRVLVSGGLEDVYKSNLLATAQLFDPATETFTPTGSMAVPRWRHSMTTLADGRVLVAGGDGRADVSEPSGDPLPPDYRSDAEIYDPKTGAFTPTGAMLQVRGPTLAVPLADGRVVVLPRWGWFSANRARMGEPVPYDPSSPVPVEIYDATTGTFAPNGTTPGIATSATPLPYGKNGEGVYVASGRILLTGTTGTPASGEALGTWAAVYDPASGRTETTASPRAWFAAPAALLDGRVLFAGGGLPDPKGGWPPDPVHWVEIFE